MTFAREWIFSRGDISGWDKLSEYENSRPFKERKYILKLVMMMDFFNQAGNMFIRIPWKYSVKLKASCALPAGDTQKSN